MESAFKIKAPTKRIPRLALLLMLMPAAGLFGQAPDYRPPPPPTQGKTVEMRLRYLLKPDVNFAGFGTVPFRTDYESVNNPVLGTERSIVYDDGVLSQDYIRTTLVEGGDPFQDIVASDNTNATSAFSYVSEDQVSADDPSALIFHRYASEASADKVLEGSTSGSMGWELNYTQYINRKRNIGVQVGFSFNGFDSRFEDQIAADLYVEEFIHRMEDGLVPNLPDPVEDADGNTTQPPYIGDKVRAEGETADLLKWLADEKNQELIADGATVDAEADLRSSIYNFRAGSTYSMNLGKSFALQLGAGVSAVYFSGRFSAYEILNNPGGGENPSRSLTTTEDAEWQVGGYVDASAHYSLTDRVSFFSGMQVQSGSNYKQANEEREANVDFNSQVYVHAGFGIKF